VPMHGSSWQKSDLDYEVTGPSYVGQNTLEWKMVYDNEPFGDIVTKSY
jgi:hypothetical protein